MYGCLRPLICMLFVHTQYIPSPIMRSDPATFEKGTSYKKIALGKDGPQVRNWMPSALVHLCIL